MAARGNLTSSNLLMMENSELDSFLEGVCEAPAQLTACQELQSAQAAPRRPAPKRPLHQEPPAPNRTRPRRFLLPTPSPLVWKAGFSPPSEATGALFLNQQPPSMPSSNLQPPQKKRRHPHHQKGSGPSNTTGRPAQACEGVLIDLN